MSSLKSSSLQIPFALVDAFTLGRSFTGNPAAVCVLPPQEVNPRIAKSFNDIKYSKPETIPKMKLSTSSSSLSFFNGDDNEDQNLTLVLQKIATEMQQSETVFVQRVLFSGEVVNKHEEEQVACVFLIRWFSPATEVMLCGHATLAASHCLFSSSLKQQNTKFVPESCRTIEYISPSFARGFRVSRDENNNKISSFFYSLQFPNNKPYQVDFMNSEDYANKVYHAIQKFVKVGDDRQSKQSSLIQVVSMWYHEKSKKYIVELDSPRSVVNLKVDVQKLHKALSSKIVFSVTFTARNHTNKNDQAETSSSSSYFFDDPQNNIVAVSRHFASWVGIPEDPVTGAAHVVLGPMWIERINKEEEEQENSTKNTNRDNKFYNFFQAFPGRGGVIRLRVENDKVVTLNGRADTVVEGMLKLTRDDVQGVVDANSSSSRVVMKSKL